jgi:ankyrin repeat protein
MPPPPAGPHDAAYEGKLAVLARLLTRDPRLAHAEDSYAGWTPLHKAAWGGQLAVVRFLVEEHGADTAAKDSGGTTPLVLARVYTQAAAVAAYLEQRGAAE